MSTDENSAKRLLSLQIGVIGGAACDAPLVDQARRLGEQIASLGATLICGGRGGVMEAACRGAQEVGGRTVGILPGVDAADSPPNPYLDVRLFTGLGQARNLCVVLSCDAVIAVGGGWGTLSEIALARKHGVPVVLLNSWRLTSQEGLVDLPRAENAARTLDLALVEIDASGRRIVLDTV